jgi:hypothetical protein
MSLKKESVMVLTRFDCIRTESSGGSCKRREILVAISLKLTVLRKRPDALITFLLLGNTAHRSDNICLSPEITKYF